MVSHGWFMLGRLRVVALAATLVTAVAAPAPAQRYADQLAVTAIEVPVQVVRGGEPIRGLTRDDFIVLDRGVERELVDFEVLDVLSPVAAPEPAAPADLPAPVAAAEPAAARHLLFLFDFQFSPRRRLELAVVGARRLVATGLAASDRVAVAIYTGSAGANILVGFTREREEIELGLAFVDALARRRPAEIRRAREELIEYWTRPAGGAAAGGGAEQFRVFASRLGTSAALALSGVSLGGEIMSLSEYDAISGAGSGRGAGGSPLNALVGPRLIDDAATEMEDLLSQLLTFGESMAELATLLRDVAQPKHLVYFSEGFPTGVLGNVETRARAISRLEPGIRAMQAGGWAIQAIDIEGVPDSLAGSGRSVTAAADPAATSFVTGNPRGDIRPQTGQAGFDAEALAYLAGETGGLVIENFNDLEKAGGRILAATAVTYLLVFQPEDLEADGRYHRLEVRLARPIPGARLLHRPGYVAPTPAAEASALARRMDEARLLTGDETVLDLAADSLALSGARARFVVEIAASELLAERSTDRLELEVQAFVFGSGDGLERWLSRRLTLDLERVGERLRRGGLRLGGALDLPYGRHRVRLLVRDLGDGRVFARSHVVENPVDDRRWAPAPLFFDPVAATVYLEVEPAGWSDVGLPPDRFVPAAGAHLPPGGTRPIFFLYFSPAPSGATVLFRVLDAAGEPVEGAGVTWQQRLPDAGDGGTRLLGTLDAGDLGPGRYRLELSVDDGEAGPPLVASTFFAVGS